MTPAHNDINQLNMQFFSLAETPNSKELQFLAFSGKHKQS